MKTLHPSLQVATAMLLALSAAATSHALLPRTFVASSGNDGNPCNPTSPCRTFGAAIAAVQAGGDVIVLDSAGYGTVTITKSVILIVPDGVYGGLAATAGDAITINAGSGDTITLRGLTIDGLGGDTGIQFVAGNTVIVERCVVNGFKVAGINFPAAGHLIVTDSTIRNNVGQESGGTYGVRVGGTAGISTLATLDHCRFIHNGVGLFADAGSKVTVRDSVAARNDNGYYANSGGSTQFIAELNIMDCLANDNNVGILNNGASIRALRSGVFNNGSGMIGAVGTQQNNAAEGNTNGATQSFTGALIQNK